MFALGLLTCAVLTAFSAHAEVVDNFNGCKQFFYMGKEPGGLDQNAKTICQMYSQDPLRRGEHPMLFPMRYYYATLYSTQHRIPLYSAYVFDPECKNARGTTKVWHVEPQISGYSNRNMVRETKKDLGNLGLNEDVIKRSQAMSSDYSFTGYDRGHLNPNSFSCGDGRTATFTLTNGAPMDPCFNRIHWFKWEDTLKSFLLNQLSLDGGLAKVYIVTGTVPNANLRIPQKEISEEPERVTVPSHIWTAVCYKHHKDNRKSFSFGYMGENQPEEPDINPMSVSNLNDQLSRLYSDISRTPWRVSIFADACFGDNNKLDKVKEKFKGKIEMSTAVQTTYRGVKRAISSGSQYSEKYVKVKEMTAKLAIDSMTTYYTMADDLKVSAGSVCLIIDSRPVVRKSVHVDLRKREVSVGSDAVECLLVPEKQRIAADGSPCSSVSESSYGCVCTSGGKPCCSSSCLYRHDLKSYRCYSGRTQIECSPQYSLITVKGERCLDDHPCAKYGEDYYWCKTDHGFIKDGWDYCSPPLWNSKAKNGKYCRSNHACAKYGSRKPWCYTDDEDNYDKCCTSDDCYSTVSGKTCRSDHKCGYHGKRYLWCYTDNRSNWDYCCKNCA